MRYLRSYKCAPVGGLFLCAVLLVLTFVQTNHTREQFFSQALEDNHVHEHVSFDSKTYLVSGGTVTRDGASVSSGEHLKAYALAYEKSLARRNPLFAFPTADIQALRDAIENVRSVSDEIAALQQNKKDRRIVKTSLYPVQMLSALADLEESRRAFLASGSESDARGYEVTLAKTLEEYRASLARFEESLDTVVPDNVRQYAVPSSIISKENTLDAIRILDEGATATHARSLRRLSCVQGVTSACEIGDLSIPHIVAGTPTRPSKRQLAYADTIVRAAKKIPFEFDDEFGDRLILLGKSECTVNDPDGAPLFAIRIVFAGLPQERLAPLYVGNAFFLHAPVGSSYADLPYLKNFAEQGVEYVLSHPLIYYECPSTTRDLGAVFVVRDTALFARDVRASGYATGELATSLRKLERKLTTSKIVYETDAAAYLSEAEVLLREPSVPDEVKGPLSSLILEFEFKSLGLYYTLLDIATAETVNMRQAAEHGVRMDFSARNIMYARNALPALFLADNSSATGQHPALFAPNTLPAASQPYAYYSTFADRSDGEDILFQSMRFYHEKLER